MQINELIDPAVSMLRKVKEDTVAKVTLTEPRKAGETDVLPIVMGFRGNAHVVSLVPAEMGRDPILKSVSLAARGYGCDVVVTCSDSWHAKDTLKGINPLTGKMFEAGEMQDLVEHHQGLEKGWIIESLMAYVVNRAGDVSAVAQDYRIIEHHDDGHYTYTVGWMDPHVETYETGTIQGYIPMVLTRIMEDTVLSTVMAQDGITAENFGLTEEQAQAHADCAITKWISSSHVFNGAMSLALGSEERERIIKMSMEGYDISFVDNREEEK